MTLAPSIEQIAARWSAHAEQYHRWGDLAHGNLAYQTEWVEALANLVGHPRRDGAPVLRIADVGTGTGEIALVLAEMGHDVTGYDIAAGMLDVARFKARAAAADIQFARGSAYRLPLAAACVDVVINRMVFWTLYDPVAALGEWRRVLSPGGLIIVIDGLHFAQPTSFIGRLGQLRSSFFWETKSRLVALRDLVRNGRDSARSHRYHADAVQPPGMTWIGIGDAAQYFTEAGMAEVGQDWLDGVYDVDRRTASLRWRVAGRLPRFFTLTWQSD